MKKCGPGSNLKKKSKLRKSIAHVRSGKSVVDLLFKKEK